MEQQYIVNLVSAVDASQRDAIAAEVEQRLGMPRAKVLKLFEQGTGPITKPVAKAVADRVTQAMQGAGVNAESVPLDWKSVLLLDGEDDAAASDQETVFDDSPLEPLDSDMSAPLAPEISADETPLAEPTIDTDATAMLEALETEKAQEPQSESDIAPSVSYTIKENIETKEDDEQDEASSAEASSHKPNVPEVPLAKPGGRRPAWLPVLLVLLVLGLAYLFLPNLLSGGETALPDPSSGVTSAADNDDTSEASQENDPSDLPEGAEGAVLDESASDNTEIPTPDETDTVSAPNIDVEPNTVSETNGGTELEAAESEVAAELEAVSESEADPEAEANPEPQAAEETVTEAESEANAPTEGAAPDPVAELIASAEAGKLEAQLELAERYATGDGAEQDYAQSAVWYERAAAAGDMGAQYELGWLYANGLGVERDLEAATRWYEAAAISGDAEAQYQLGFYRYYGQGGEQDLEEARNLFRAAAEQGVAEARFRLGVMYLEGEGGDVDEAEAERWLRLAGQQGISEVEPYLERIVENASQMMIEPDATESQISSSPVIPLSSSAAANADSVSGVGEDGLQLLGTSESLSAIDKAFFELVKTEDAVAIAEAIRSGANVNARDAYGQTPLMYAASHNGPNAIAELIVDLAEVDAQSTAGWTALMYAARDNPGVVEALLVRGADPTLSNSDGQTALDIAEASASSAVDLLTEALENAEAPDSEFSDIELTDNLN